MRALKYKNSGNRGFPVHFIRVLLMIPLYSVFTLSIRIITAIFAVVKVKLGYFRVFLCIFLVNLCDFDVNLSKMWLFYRYFKAECEMWVSWSDM